MFSTLIQSDIVCATRRRYLLRVSTDEQTLRSLNGAFEEKDKSWMDRKPYDSVYFSRIRYMMDIQKNLQNIDKQSDDNYNNVMKLIGGI